jgi:hypothetical protein
MVGSFGTVTTLEIYKRSGGGEALVDQGKHDHPSSHEMAESVVCSVRMVVVVVVYIIEQ